MKILRPFKIIGVGRFLPPNKVTNEDIEQELQLPAGWIYKYTGVKSRHRVKEETISSMGHQALKNALKDASLNLNNLDMLIGSGASFDYILPNRSSSIAHLFEESEDCNFPCVDINSTCVSFISALNYASYVLQEPDINTLAIVTSEVASKGLNSKNPETYSLFGDGATAVIITKSEDSKAGLTRHLLNTYTACNQDTIIKGGGVAFYPKDHPYNEDLYSFKMNGKRLLRFTKSILPSYLNRFFDNIPRSLKDLDFIIPHQASKLGLKLFDEFANQYSKENVVKDQLEKYGNCISVSIPLALVDSIKEGKIKRGDECLLIGTAAGISIGGLLFIY